MLKVALLLLEESHLVHILLLQLDEVLLHEVDVFEDFSEQIVQTLSSVLLEGGAFRPQQLRILLVVVQSLDAIFGAGLQHLDSLLDGCVLGLHVVACRRVLLGCSGIHYN